MSQPDREDTMDQEQGFEQSKEDRAIVERQERALSDAKDRETIVDAVIERHARTRDGGDTEFARSSIDRAPGDSVLIVTEELLVRSADAHDAAKVLMEAGIAFAGPDEVACATTEHRLPISRLRVSSAELVTAMTALHAATIEAGCNHVLPAGPVVKGGEAGPGKPTASQLPFPDDPSAGKGVIVAVIDTGIADGADTVHQTFLAGVVAVDGRFDQLDTLSPAGLDFGAGHGTFVAGVIRQVAPAADVRVYRALDADGIGSEVDVACAMIRAALDDGAHIINLSLGQQSFADRPPVALAAALEMIPDEVVIIAAAGNDGDTRPCWPGAFRRVVAVAARSTSGGPAPYSNHGAWIDASTLGSGVVSTFVSGVEEPGTSQTDDWTGDPTPIAIWSGTSFAAPQVAGLVAQNVAASGSARAALATVLASGWFMPDMGVTIDSPLR